MTAKKSLRKNEYFKTLVAVFLIIAVVLGIFFGLGYVLHTPYPVLTVVSGSMSIPFDNPQNNYDNNFWLTLSTPFDRTLSVGDIIIIQGVNPKDLDTNYPNSNIIVFHDPDNPSELIVHRIVSAQTYNGQLYFITKGDGNGNPWPQTPQTGFDPWDSNSPPGVPASMVVGKVVLRIPWLGWVTIFVKDNQFGLSAIIAIILLIVFIGFILPSLRTKKPKQEIRTNPLRATVSDLSTAIPGNFIQNDNFLGVGRRRS